MDDRQVILLEGFLEGRCVGRVHLLRGDKPWDGSQIGEAGEEVGWGKFATQEKASQWLKDVCGAEEVVEHKAKPGA